MNILVITSEALKEFPPIITMLDVLVELKHNVTCITLAKDEVLETKKDINNLFFREKKINCVERHQTPRLIASVAFRIDKYTKIILCKKIAKKFHKEIKDADVVWVMHENTFLYGGNKLVQNLPEYIYTMYELPLKVNKTKKIYELAASKASTLVSPEYCRAHIMKAIYGRNSLPCIIPNKPLNHPFEREIYIQDDEIRNKIEQIERSGKKIIMYMGIISNERPLEPMIKAISNVRDKYEFVVLGAWTRYLDEIRSKYENDFTYLGSVTPPHHLEIASHAHIAYVSYVPQQRSINAVFCAPNKVYEFAGFGVPMLCNDVPGLKYVVEKSQMGICISDFNDDSVIKAIEIIENKYEKMKQSAIDYFNSEDLYQMTTDVLNDYNNVLRN